ncbi:hypothetical protein OIT44_03920 [Weissella ceti]|uniref:Uncharacterized protein n=1 Tax=Weissella ceti TaxID=759620 RepID=A0ABT3E473_9LACO|nr:hypothetical protein [Weissella ceti]MCW0953221.1 hypothetical protein [Weissella ceti]QVK12737.1 hypothetical protein KHQ31_03680 [Weissella ceti]
MFIGEKTPEKFKEDLVEKVRQQPRNARYKMRKLYRDGGLKNFPYQDWKSCDRNALIRTLYESGFWNVTAVSIQVWESEEFPNVF